MTARSKARAAVLAVRCDAVVSHTTCAGFRGLVVPEDPDFHLTVDVESRVRLKGVRVHRVPLSDADIELLDGIPVTRLDRTIIDCLLTLPEQLGRALLVDALRRRMVDRPTLRRALTRVGRRHGVARARSVLADVAGVPHSEMEVRVHRILRAAGIHGWEANARIDDAMGLVGFVDLLFGAHRLVVELDGRAYHSDPASFQRDRERQNRLMMLGYTVLRFTWDDVVNRPAELVAQVQAALINAVPYQP